MVSTFTPNVQIEQPARGDAVGTWDTPVNNNMGLIDLISGGIATIPISNANVTLSPAQYKCSTLIFTGLLTTSLSIFFPSSFIKSYIIHNQCGGITNFYFRCASVSSLNTLAPAPPPGIPTTIYNDGIDIRFVNLGPPIGTYVDFANFNVPPWVAGSVPNPYLYCGGGTFASTTYPVLAAILGGTTLPDSRGSVRLSRDNGAGRIGVQIAPDTIGALGGNEIITLNIGQIPAHSHTISDPGHTHAYVAPALQGSQYGNGTLAAVPSQAAANTNAAVTGITITNTGGSSAHSNLQPSYIGGITMIRAG